MTREKGPFDPFEGETSSVAPGQANQPSCIADLLRIAGGINTGIEEERAAIDYIADYLFGAIPEPPVPVNAQKVSATTSLYGAIEELSEALQVIARNVDALREARERLSPLH